MNDILAEREKELFNVSVADLLEGVRSAGRSQPPTSQSAAVLCSSRLLDEDGLTENGRVIYRAAWIHGEILEAKKSLASAIRTLAPIQVLEQELRGFPPVFENGVAELLQFHRLAPDGLTVDGLRSTLGLLNELGIIAYSKRYKTVRLLLPPVESAAAGESNQMAVMISPRTPFSNIVRLRRILRQLAGDVYWLDPHFGTRALEELALEIDPALVSYLRILSGDAANVVSTRTVKDFERFKEEMQLKGVRCEWRIDRDRDWHDRWLLAEGVTYNLPPVNTLYKNDYSEILPTDSRPPVNDWWSRSSPLTI